MILHFYALDCVEGFIHAEVEVKETPKKYKVKNIHKLKTYAIPSYHWLLKEDTGKMLDSSHSLIFLTERNDKKIKRMFLKRCERDLNTAKSKFEYAEKMLKFANMDCEEIGYYE